MFLHSYRYRSIVSSKNVEFSTRNDREKILASFSWYRQSQPILSPSWNESNIPLLSDHLMYPVCHCSKEQLLRQMKNNLESHLIDRPFLLQRSFRTSSLIRMLDISPRVSVYDVYIFTSMNGL